MDQFSRTRIIIGESGMEKLQDSHVAIFGIGGVGGYIAEALARCGIGSFTIVDCDTISMTNINRQIIALHSTIGMAKVDVMKNRILEINPNAVVNCINKVYNSETADEIFNPDFTYIADAIDMVSAKLDLITRAFNHSIPVISSMGTGNKFDPSRFKITDISKTSVCPLARVMRKELSDRGIKKLKVLFSDEVPVKPFESEEYIQELALSGKRQIPGSISFVPPVAGLMIASEIVNDILKGGAV